MFCDVWLARHVAPRQHGGHLGGFSQASSTDTIFRATSDFSQRLLKSILFVPAISPKIGTTIRWATRTCH